MGMNSAPGSNVGQAPVQKEEEMNLKLEMGGTYHYKSSSSEKLYTVKLVMFGEKSDMVRLEIIEAEDHKPGYTFNTDKKNLLG